METGKTLKDKQTGEILIQMTEWYNNVFGAVAYFKTKSGDVLPRNKKYVVEA